MLRDKLSRYGQMHLIAYENELSEQERSDLYAQISGIDFEKVKELYESAASGTAGSDENESVIEPISYVDKKNISESIRNENIRLGNKILSEGGFAAVTMAGGQGTRLGHMGPKGTYDIGLSNGWSLFQIQCERLKKTSLSVGKTIPWYIMTSRENDDATRAFFKEHDYFGYPKDDIVFFVQNMLPMVDFDGKIVLDTKGHVKEGADGHGGIFAALKTSGSYEDMKKRGIKWAFIGGIDNVLLRLSDPEFIGFAENSGCKIAAKSLVKRAANENVGVFCKRNGKPSVVEYTEISDEMANAVDENGGFLYGDAHILCNIFSMDAISDMLENNDGLPYHVAKKKTQTVKDGETVLPEKPNAYKFEAFIFDAFERFDDIAILRVPRELEFAPVKNREGQDSPETAREMYEAAEKAGDVL